MMKLIIRKRFFYKAYEVSGQKAGCQGVECGFKTVVYFQRAWMA